MWAEQAPRQSKRNDIGQMQPARLGQYTSLGAHSCRLPACGSRLLAFVLAIVLLSMAWPSLVLAQGGVTYVVQPGDSLGYIAATYGTTVAAIMQANGLNSPDTLWAGQSLTIPIQKANTGSNVGAGASSYTVALGDSLNSIAQSLGVSPSALAAANGLTNPDMLYIGQRLLVPGTTLGGLALAAPSGASTPGRYSVRPGDTLYGIAAALGVSVADLQSANQLTNTDLLVVGQRLVIPKAGVAASAVAPVAVAPPATSPAPLGLGAAKPAGSPPDYVVQPGDTLNSIAGRLGVTAADLAKANSLSNLDVLSIGQRLFLPAPAGAAPSPAPASASSPASSASAPETSHHAVQPGETLGSIARQYNTTAAAIARINKLTSPDMVTVGMTLIIPAPDWTAPGITGQASRFVASISQQHCWLYQGTELIGSWTCSTGRPGADTIPGSYRIQSKIDRAFGSTWNFWMPYWLGIYWAGASENGIHSIPEDANTLEKVWEGFVGTPITYGCVLLNPEHAKQLYDVAYIGMPVIIQP